MLSHRSFSREAVAGCPAGASLRTRKNAVYNPPLRAKFHLLHGDGDDRCTAAGGPTGRRGKHADDHGTVPALRRCLARRRPALRSRP
ncbi:hypothetical protein A33M_1508 [Rhodovulum sp. PH10]|nr:hypothetical protein A33M_1508 [Rhodovulum sp. PH10]